MGVKGACPLALPPPLGERGGHHPNSTEACGKDFNSAIFPDNRTDPPRGIPSGAAASIPTGGMGVSTAIIVPEFTGFPGKFCFIKI